MTDRMPYIQYMTVLYLGYYIYIVNTRLERSKQFDFMLIYYFCQGLCVSDIRTLDRDFRWILEDLGRCNPKPDIKMQDIQ